MTWHDEKGIAMPSAKPAGPKRPTDQPKPPARRGPYICGIDAAMDVVSGKWKSLILWELNNYGTRRFGELRRGLVGVSEKMLIQQLREMEADGLIHRKVYAEVPPRVEYTLTEHGTSLNAALGPLGSWGTERVRRLDASGSLEPQPGDG